MTNSFVARFLGGSPVAVLLRLIVASFVVGLLLEFFRLRSGEPVRRGSAGCAAHHRIWVDRRAPDRPHPTHRRDGGAGLAGAAPARRRTDALERDAIGLNRRRHRGQQPKKPGRRRKTDGAPTAHSCQLVTRPAHCRFERFQRIGAELALFRTHASWSRSSANRTTRKGQARASQHPSRPIAEGDGPR